VILTAIPVELAKLIGVFMKPMVTGCDTGNPN